LFGLVASFLITFAKVPVILFIAIAIVVTIALASGLVVRRNEHVRHLLTEGWAPLFGAMIITSGSGLVLDTFVERYAGYALLAIAFGGKSSMIYYRCKHCI
jgi:solute carrier family 41